MWTHYKGVLFFEFSNGKSFEKSIMTNHNRVVNSMNWMQIKGTRASLLGKWKWMETPLKFTRCLHDNIIYLIEAIAWCALYFGNALDLELYTTSFWYQQDMRHPILFMDDIVPITTPCEWPILCHGWYCPNYHAM
jgi:hypothetical protein